jgi:hypothetical protein
MRIENNMRTLRKRYNALVCAQTVPSAPVVALDQVRKFCEYKQIINKISKIYLYVIILLQYVNMCRFEENIKKTRKSVHTLSEYRSLE